MDLFAEGPHRLVRQWGACLSVRPWGLCSASASSHRTILERVSFECPSYMYGFVKFGMQTSVSVRIQWTVV
jgi:hypothetical protein